MKKNLFKAMTIAAVLLVVTSFAHGAGRCSGMGMKGQGENSDIAGMGERGMHGDIVSEGTPFSYTGEVGTAEGGFSLELLTLEGETVSIHGIGPEAYWETLTASRPVAGGMVTITGYTVEFQENIRNIAFTVESNGETTEIRDAEGKPMWRQPLDILSGTPFEYSGTVVTAEEGFGSPTVIMTESGEEIAVRTGPAMYWDSLGISQPEVGEVITVIGYSVTVNEVEVNVAATVLVGEDVVELLDEEGRPLWKKRGGKGKGF